MDRQNRHTGIYVLRYSGSKAIEIHKNIQSFISTLEERGFIVQQGQLSHVDFLKLCSEGIVDNCLGNNVDALYGGCALPPAPNQDPSPEQDPPINYDPDNPNNYPANIVYIKPGFVYKLRPDEAIVLIGQTPPPAYYFSFRSYLAFVQNKPDKDYSEVFTTGDDYTGVYHRIAASLGDQLNNFRIWTDNTPGGAAGEPFNSSTIVIITADKSVNQQIRDALGVAGYSSDIINDDIIPLELVNMGLEKGKDTFISIVRIEIPDERKFGEAYSFVILGFAPQNRTGYITRDSLFVFLPGQGPSTVSWSPLFSTHKTHRITTGNA